MTGLNHEMNRELLWNGYPTDQRGTFFQQFWDFRGWVQSPDQPARTEDKFVDIKPITEWGTTNLGTHSGRVPPAQIVLVVRGDVLKRYPNVVVYASQAVSVNGKLTLNDGKQRFPVFQALLTGDTALYGFELSADDARGPTADAPLGYFFVLQEHPSEPHFKKQGTVPNGIPSDYSNKSPSTPLEVKAGADVPQQAYEQPTRVALHGNDLLPPST